MSDNNSDYSEYYTVDANENDDNPLGSDNSTSNVKSLDDILHDSGDNSVIKSLNDAYENVGELLRPRGSMAS